MYACDAHVHTTHSRAATHHTCTPRTRAQRLKGLPMNKSISEDLVNKVRVRVGVRVGFEYECEWGWGG